MRQSLRKWLIRLLGLAACIMLLGACSLASLFVICRAEIPEVRFDTDIETFVGHSEYAAHDLILAAHHEVQADVGYMARVGSGFTSAVYRCEARACQLEDLYSEIGARSFIECDPRFEGNISVAFVIEPSQNHVRVRTYDLGGLGTISERQLPTSIPTMDEAIEAMWDFVEPALVKAHPVTSVYIFASGQGYWEATVRDLDEHELAVIQIPFEN